MTDEPKWKLPDALVKASAKVADKLNVEYSPTNINITVNLQVTAGEGEEVARVMLDALRMYAPELRGLSTEVRSTMLESSGVTATLAIKGAPSTNAEESS